MMRTLAIVVILVVSMSHQGKADFDFDFEDYWPFLGMVTGGSQCAPYGTTCAQKQCCQYLSDRMACFNGQCLQHTCGYPGQECGAFIGNCCYHLNLKCSNYFIGGTCVPNA